MIPSQSDRQSILQRRLDVVLNLVKLGAFVFQFLERTAAGSSGATARCVRWKRRRSQRRLNVERRSANDGTGQELLPDDHQEAQLRCACVAAWTGHVLLGLHYTAHYVIMANVQLVGRSTLLDGPSGSFCPPRHEMAARTIGRSRLRSITSLSPDAASWISCDRASLAQASAVSRSLRDVVRTSAAALHRRAVERVDAYQDPSAWC